MSAEPDDLSIERRTEDVEPSANDGSSVAPDPSATLPPPPADTPDGGTDTNMDASVADEEGTSLLADERATSFRHRWDEIQVRFVDEPRPAVEDADRLVTEVIEQLQASFTSERGRLEGQWQQGGEVSTEDLRVALQRYRSFFDRLLAA